VELEFRAKSHAGFMWRSLPGVLNSHLNPNLLTVSAPVSALLVPHFPNYWWQWFHLQVQTRKLLSYFLKTESISCENIMCRGEMSTSILNSYILQKNYKKLSISTFDNDLGGWEAESIHENFAAIPSKQLNHFRGKRTLCTRRAERCAVSIVIKPFALLSYNNCITRRRRSLRLQGALCIVTLITSRKLC